MSDQLTLFFNKDNNSITIQCQKGDKIEDVFKRYCTKSGENLNDLKFYYNSKEVRVYDKSLFALGIENRSTFNVVLAKHVIGA